MLSTLKDRRVLPMKFDNMIVLQKFDWLKQLKRQGLLPFF